MAAKTFSELNNTGERIVAVTQWEGWVIVATNRTLYRIFPSGNIEEMKFDYVEGMPCT